jgi:protein-disulfide isomerase
MKKAQKARRSAKPWLIPSIILVAVAGLALIATTGNSSNKSAPVPAPSNGVTASPSAAPLPNLARRKAGDPLAMGNVNAPVVMIEYAEFQCPFCGKFARDTEPTLIDKYVRNGTLRIEWRDFPYLGHESTTAALASRAAANQGKFWQYHDYLFAHQFAPNNGDLTDSYLTGLAKMLGLNVKKFQSDFHSVATQQAVAADFTEGQNIGVTGTPSFLVNSTPIVGAQPVAIFEHAIEQAAAQAK